MTTIDVTKLMDAPATICRFTGEVPERLGHRS